MTRPPISFHAEVRPAKEISALKNNALVHFKAAHVDAGKCLEHLRQVGRLLIEIRDNLRHGSFNAWLKENMPFSRSSAYTYIGYVTKPHTCPTAGQMMALESNGSPQDTPSESGTESPPDDEEASPEADNDEEEDTVDGVEEEDSAEEDEQEDVESDGEADEPEEKPPPTDPLGLPLPPESVEPFSLCEKFDEALRLHRQLSALVDEIAQAPGGERFRAHACGMKERDGKQTFYIDALSNLAYAFKGHRPFSSRCPWCLAQGRKKNHKDCNGCHGLGYVTKYDWEQCSDEHRNAIEELAGKDGAA